MTIFPIARASAVVVQTTSVVLGFINTLYLKDQKRKSEIQKTNNEIIDLLDHHDTN